MTAPTASFLQSLVDAFRTTREAIKDAERMIRLTDGVDPEHQARRAATANLRKAKAAHRRATHRITDWREAARIPTY